MSIKYSVGCELDPEPGKMTVVEAENVHLTRKRISHAMTTMQLSISANVTLIQLLCTSQSIFKFHQLL